MRLLLVLSCFMSFPLWSQRDSLSQPVQIQADVIVNTNGISRIPSLSLMKPAVQANLFLRKGRWVLDPQFFFSLEAKPWINNFWLHYYAVQGKKWSVMPGGSLMLTHKSVPVQINGQNTERTVASRYLDLDLLISRKLTKHLSLNAYYLYIHGLDPGTFQALHFGALSAAFQQIPLGKSWEFRANPQVYYLTQNGMEGYYFSLTTGVKPRSSDFGLFGMINAPFQTNYVPDNGFIWSLGINWMPHGKIQFR